MITNTHAGDITEDVHKCLRPSLRHRQEEYSLLDDTINAKYAEMFEDPVKNDKGRPTVSLGEVSEILSWLSSEVLHSENNIENGYAVVEPANIVDGNKDISYPRRHRC